MNRYFFELTRLNGQVIEETVYCKDLHTAWTELIKSWGESIQKIILMEADNLDE